MSCSTFTFVIYMIVIDKPLTIYYYYYYYLQIRIQYKLISICNDETCVKKRQN